MDRRQFLKQLAGVAAAQLVPIELVDGVPKLAEVAAAVPKVEVFAPYGLAFMVTKEMVEDEVYGQMLEVIDQLPGYIPEWTPQSPIELLEGEQIKQYIHSDRFLVRLKDEPDGVWPAWAYE